MEREDIEFFDATADYSVIERKLPHWIQSGALCFVTWRAADSLPDVVLDRLDSEIHELLQRFELEFNDDWKNQLSNRPPAVPAKVVRYMFETRDKYLGEGHGRCLLARPECALDIEHSLLKFDGDRYFMTDIVVMPNHVHFIAAFRDEEFFLKQCTDWKRYTARQINRLCACSGEYWQVDQFDHLIRSGDAFGYFRDYIAENPSKANLKQGQFRYYTKEL